MHPIAILSSLAIFTTVLAAPNVEYYSTPKPTPAPTAASISAAPEPTKPPTADELRRRSMTPALEIRGVLGKRDTCPLTGYYSCNNGYCCQDGTICYDTGLCYDPTVDYQLQVSSILAAYTSEYTLDAYYSSAYESYLSELSSIYYSYGSTTENSYATGTRSGVSQTNSASTDNSDLSSISGSRSSSKKKGKTGIISGAVVGVVVIIILVLVGLFIYRRNNKKTAAVQQPLMSQPPPPPPPPTQPPTPGPMPPYSPGPYGQNAAAAAAGKHDSVHDYKNYSTPPPGTVEMPGNQNLDPQQPYGQNPYPNGVQYQPPPLPVAGIVEAGGNTVYHPSQQPAPQYTPVSTSSPQSTGATSGGQYMISPQTTGSTGSHIPGAIPPPLPPSGPVYEMATSNYRQY